ncbi:MAG: hypothetical protein ABMB14_21630 [Myxococcota bacterium]
MIGWWLLTACDGAGDGSSATPTDAPPPPDVAVEPVGPGTTVVPCDGTATVNLVNHDTVDHVVDAIVFSPSTDLARLDLTDVELPRIVHPGVPVPLTVRLDGEAPRTTAATIAITWEAGASSASVSYAAVYGAAEHRTFTVGTPQVDLLLAVDHSGSMAANYADELAEGLPRLLDALTAAADWQAILVTSDDGCSNGPVYTAGDPNAAGRIADHAFDPSPDDDLTEALLELASRALAENAPTECNATFLRPGSELVVLTVSDEPEQSGRDADYWVDDFGTYSASVIVSAVADARGRCGDGGEGYADAADATGGVVIDLCDRGWGDDLDQVADGLGQRPPSFVLGSDALPDTVEVTVDGESARATFDAATGTVTLRDAAPAGAKVAVDWVVPAVCAD